MKLTKPEKLIIKFHSLRPVERNLMKFSQWDIASSLEVQWNLIQLWNFMFFPEIITKINLCGINKINRKNRVDFLTFSCMLVEIPKYYFLKLFSWNWKQCDDYVVRRRKMISLWYGLGVYFVAAVKVLQKRFLRIVGCV